MPSSRLSLRLTDSYRERLLRLRDRAIGLVAARWRVIALEDLDGSYDAWLAEAVVLVTAAQAQGVRLSDAYLAAFLTAELGDPVAPRGFAEDRYAGLGQDGRALGQILLAPLLGVKQAIGEARTPELALQTGLSRTARAVGGEVLWSSRQALADGMADDERVEGWRRVTSARACGACLASATDTVQERGELPRTHGHCRCTAEPVVAGHHDRFRRPTGREVFDRMTTDEQAALFHGRGGEEKAKLISSGAVPFEALVAVSPMATVDDQITEAPLSALKP